MVERDGGDIAVPSSEQNLDGLNYLTGRSMTEINRKAYEGTARAHANGDVPVMTLWMDAVSPEAVGAAIYFFEHAVGIGGYMMGLRPVEPPGLEANKGEIVRLLGVSYRGTSTYRAPT